MASIGQGPYGHMFSGRDAQECYPRYRPPVPDRPRRCTSSAKPQQPGPTVVFGDPNWATQPMYQDQRAYQAQSTHDGLLAFLFGFLFTWLLEPSAIRSLKGPSRRADEAFIIDVHDHPEA